MTGGTEQAEAMAELYGEPKPIVGTVRASAFQELLDCAQRFYWKQIEGLRMPSSGAAHLGTALHKSTAAYDQSRLDGDGATPDDTAAVLVDAIHQPEEDVDWGDENPKRAEQIGLQLHTGYCTQVAPQQDYQAVELECEALDVATEHGTVRLTGTTDRVRRTPQGSGIADLKSGKRAVGTDGKAVTQGHHVQLGVYSLLAEHVMGEPMAAGAEVIGLQTTSKARVGTGEVADVYTPLVGTDDHPGLIEMAAQMLEAGLFPPNPRSPICSPKYCPAHRDNGGPCKYHS
jgi:hypothetical protein